MHLKDLTTLQVGGTATVWQVQTEAELPEAISYASARNEGWRVLGGGSNILASDNACQDLVLKIALLGRSVIESGDAVLLTVAAGEDFDAIIAHTVANGWWGLENLSHIPGTVGATPVQNVGAYGVEIQDVIESVKVFDSTTQTTRVLTAAECQFGYRDSLFKQSLGKQLIVTELTYRLSKTPRPVLHYKDLAERFVDGTPRLEDIRNAIISIRSQKFPDWKRVGTAGSFFKNPIISRAHYETLQTSYPELPMYEHGPDTVKIPLGYVFDKVLAVRGKRTGSVGTYEGQALVLVNYGGASATEITEFAEALTAAVKAKLDIVIEWEVTRWWCVLHKIFLKKNFMQHTNKKWKSYSQIYFIKCLLIFFYKR